MEDINEHAFIKTTIDTYKDKNLEHLVSLAKNKSEEVKKFTENPNKLIKIMTWLFLLIFMFIMLPMVVCGISTKGFTWMNQKYFALASIFIVLLVLLKRHV